MRTNQIEAWVRDKNLITVAGRQAQVGHLAVDSGNYFITCLAETLDQQMLHRQFQSSIVMLSPVRNTRTNQIEGWVR